eukprot:8223219-Alexandrium_andersonii.AAC.1
MSNRVPEETAPAVDVNRARGAGPGVLLEYGLLSLRPAFHGRGPLRPEVPVMGQPMPVLGAADAHPADGYSPCA